MRRCALWGAALLSAAAYAGDGFLGTKPSPVAGPMQADTGGAGFMPFLQMLIALGIVLALLKLVLPKLAAKLNKKIVTRAGAGIQIEESAAFAGGSLYIVTVRGKTLLLSAASTGVACLADLTAEASGEEEVGFEQTLRKEVQGPLQPFALVEQQPHSVKEDPAAALERLRRLAG